MTVEQRGAGPVRRHPSWSLVLAMKNGERAVGFEDETLARAALAEAQEAAARGGPATIAGRIFVVDAADIVSASLRESGG